MELSLLTAKTSLDRSLIEVGGEGSLEGGSLWSQDKLITILIAQLEGGDELALYVTASLSKPRLQAHLSRASPDRQSRIKPLWLWVSWQSLRPRQILSPRLNMDVV